MRALIVIPAYNEQESILGVVRSVEAAGYEYVVINDGSTDATARVCEEHGLNFVDLPINLGIGGAVQTGHRYALLHGYDADVQMDGDGQHDVGYVGDLLAQVERGADLVIGSRFVVQEGAREEAGFRSTAIRRAGIRWLCSCIRMVCGVSVTDATSGFRASGRSALELFARRYPVDYPEPESIVLAHNAGLAVREVPVAMRERQGGRSSINAWGSVYYMVKVTLAILIEGMGRRGRRRS